MSQIQWFPGHMAKGKKLIEEYYKVIDAVLFVVDARAPYSSIHESFTKTLIPRDKCFLVMSKSELSRESENKKWIEYFKKDFNNVVALDLTKNNNTKKVLTKMLDSYFNKNNIKRKQIMVLGVPNVGKSTLINTLAGKKVAKTGDKPSITRGVTWVTTPSGYRIFDTPGILEPKIKDNNSAYKLAVINAVKNEILDMEDIVFYLLNFLISNYKKNILYFADVDSESEFDAISIENKIIEDKGFLISGKEYDYERFYTYLLRSFRKGKLGKVTLDIFDSTLK